MPQYQSITLGSAISQLSVRLADPNNVHWSVTEHQNAISESLRIFQALTGTYRERIAVPTAPMTGYYNLSVTNPTQYPVSVTDDQLLAEIQSHLKEPVANPWTGTAQFSISAISTALTRARNQYLTDTGIYGTICAPIVATSGNGRVQLPQSTLDVRHVSWTDSVTSRTYSLFRTDEYAANGFSYGWQQSPGTPYSYSIALGLPLTLQLIPTPANSGTLQLVTIQSGPILPCSPSSPVAIGLPDDYSWAVKWAALADLLSEDGPAYDPSRAALCRQLYNLAVSVGRTPTTIMAAQIADKTAPVGAIDDYDGYYTEWQNPTPTIIPGGTEVPLFPHRYFPTSYFPPAYFPPSASGQSTGLSVFIPDSVLTVTPNVFVLSPAPSGIANITFDIVRAMPVPTAPTDYLQVSQDMLEPILDMAQRILSFKLAGAEFAATAPLQDNFLRMAGTQNSRLLANVFYRTLLEQPATRQASLQPRLVEVNS